MATGALDTGSLSGPLRQTLAARVALVASDTYDDPTGIGTYTRQLAERLPHRIDGFCCVRNPEATPSADDALTLPLPPYLKGRTLRRLGAPAFLASKKLHIMHFPTEMSMYLLRFGVARVVVTVHGLASILLPAELHERLPRRARFKYKQLLESADRIITVSESSKRDIISVYDVAPERIIVVYNGIDEVYRPAADPFAPRTVEGRPYLLSVGATIPKKNISTVLRALAALKERGLPHRLIHIGPPGSAQASLEDEVRRFNLRGDVEFKGYETKESLAEFYRNASALLFPSFHEGFGIPIVEAMASGCPVITSTAYSMPEVAGEAALLVDPYNVEALITQSHRLLTNDALHRELVELGLKRARRFSWNRCADETVAVYREVLEDDGKAPRS